VGQQDAQERKSEEAGVEVIGVDGEQAGDESCGQRHGQHGRPRQEQPLADEIHFP